MDFLNLIKDLLSLLDYMKKVDSITKLSKTYKKFTKKAISDFRTLFYVPFSFIK